MWRRPLRVLDGRLYEATGFTLLELVIAMTVVGIIAAIAVPAMQRAREQAEISKAVADIKIMEMGLVAYFQEHETYPETLAEVDMEHLVDPWGNPYQYLRIYDPNARSRGRGGGGVANARKDKFLVPINSDFDLYSVGPDGVSVPALTARASKDDIVRASNGGFVGIAELY